MDYPVICDDNCFLKWFDNGYKLGEDIIYAFAWSRGQEAMLDPKHKKRENPYPNTIPKTFLLKVKDRFFKVNWYESYAGIFDDIWFEGNLFEEFPVFAVLDGLDAVQLLFHKIHIKACERLQKRANEMIESYNSTNEHLRKIYKPGGYYNKENKNIQ